MQYSNQSEGLLEHPNIGTLLDVGRQDGIDALLPGSDLRSTTKAPAASMTTWGGHAFAPQRRTSKKYGCGNAVRLLTSSI